jgi:hypothetical protein
LAVTLVCGLVILPLRAIDLDSLQAAHADEARGFQYLSKQFLDELRRSSHQGPLAYFETEYFGGLGGQGAAVFQNGELIFGPHWAEIGPIDRALKPGALRAHIGYLQRDGVNHLVLVQGRSMRAARRRTPLRPRSPFPMAPRSRFVDPSRQTLESRDRTSGFEDEIEGKRSTGFRFR